MKKLRLLFLVPFAGLAITLFSCKKTEDATVSTPQRVVGQAITGDTLSGSVKGTLVTRSAPYYLKSDVTINPGDTLLVQKGVTVVAVPNKNAGIIVNGVLICLGTKDSPIYFTASTKSSASSEPYSFSNTAGAGASDPAFQGQWAGIHAGNTCQALVFKWTHVEYVGGNVSSSLTALGYTSGDANYAIDMGVATGPAGVAGSSYTAATNPYFIFEDSWLYGNQDDGIRLGNCRASVMRSTFEKNGYQGGDAVNVKTGVTGDFAYNVFYGSAANGHKFAFPTAGTQPKVACYNNTCVNGGWRQIKTGRGGSVNFENGAAGVAFNNIFANCKTGLRITNGTSVSDTAHLGYSNNLYYGYSNLVDGSVSTFLKMAVNKQSSITTKRQVGDIIDSITNPNASPLFVSYVYPSGTGTSPYSYNNQNLTGNPSNNYHLSSGSKALGTTASPASATSTQITALVSKAGISGAPMKVVPVGGDFGATITTPHSTDLGAYPADGTGNLH